MSDTRAGPGDPAGGSEPTAGTGEPSAVVGSAGEDTGTRLVREIGWPSAFWNTLGGAALMVFSVGYIAVLDGPVSVLIWVVSVVIGFFMCFIYAEMASAFPDKSGGPSVFGAWTWGRHLKLFSPVDIMAYWFAWSPIIAIGALLIGDYVKAQWFPGQNWSLNFLFFHINFPFVVGLVTVLALLYINHFGIKESSWISAAMGIFAMVPLALLILIPIFRGQIHLSYLHPFVTPNGTWLSWQTFELICAGLFVAGWSAYAAEISVAYTAEFTRPKRDTPLAIFASAGINLFFYGLGPFVLLTAVGVKGLQGDPSTALRPLASIAFGPLAGVFIVFLIAALVLSIQTTVLGSARTIYQASKDRWTFGYFRWTSKDGVPLKAMATDIVFNIFLMLLGNPIAILAASTIGYLSFHMINTLAGYMFDKHHGRAKPDSYFEPRKPTYFSPKTLIRLGIVWTAVNFVLIFVGSPSWGWSRLALGWAIVLVGIPIWYFRQWSERRRVTRPAGPAGHAAAGRAWGREGGRLREGGVTMSGEIMDDVRQIDCESGEFDHCEVDESEVEQAERRRGPAPDAWRLVPMGAYLLVLGLFFYLVQWQGWQAWGYPVGLTVLGVWMVGFLVARGNARNTWYWW
jgi:amino acid transporter